MGHVQTEGVDMGDVQTCMQILCETSFVREFPDHSLHVMVLVVFRRSHFTSFVRFLVRTSAQLKSIGETFSVAMRHDFSVAK